MHCGESEDQAVGRLGDDGDRVRDVLRLQGLEDAVLTLADTDAAGQVLKMVPFFFALPNSDRSAMSVCCRCSRAGR
jgi:hypothetical protein